MTKLIQAIALGAARSGIMGAGAWLASHGWATADQAGSLEGSLIFLAGFGFSVFDKFVVDSQVRGSK